MQSIEKVNLSGTNQIRFMAQPEDNSETKESSVKKYFTAPNVILGSLATVGVLGMADVLICKGKHLNKLTGKGKELEEALSRATTAETKLKGTEAKLEELLAISGNDGEKIKALEDNINKLKAKLSDLDGIEGGKKIFLETIQTLYHDAQTLDRNAKQRFCEIINDCLEQLGCKIVEPSKDLDSKNFYIEYSGKLKDVNMAKPAIINIETGECILPGRAFYPESMKPE